MTRNSRNQQETWGKNSSRVLSAGVLLVWASTAGLLLATVAWVYLDARAPADRGALGISVAASQRVGVAEPAALVVLGLLVMLASLFVGPATFRNTRGWLLLTLVLSGWLGLVVGWDDLYWAGQARRLQQPLPAAEQLANTLLNDWPTTDGDLPSGGAFLAYPRAAPRMLLLLGSASLAETGVSFSSVEHSPSSAIRFELTGDNSGAWLERRADGSQPTSFVGGLQTKYDLRRCQRLNENWWLVRYQADTG